MTKPRPAHPKPHASKFPSPGEPSNSAGFGRLARTAVRAISARKGSGLPMAQLGYSDGADQIIFTLGLLVAQLVHISLDTILS